MGGFRALQSVKKYVFSAICVSSGASTTAFKSYICLLSATTTITTKDAVCANILKELFDCRYVWKVIKRSTLLWVNLSELLAFFRWNTIKLDRLHGRAYQDGPTAAHLTKRWSLDYKFREGWCPDGKRPFRGRRKARLGIYFRSKRRPIQQSIR